MDSAAIASISGDFITNATTLVTDNIGLVLTFVAGVVVLSLILRKVVSWTRRVF